MYLKQLAYIVFLFGVVSCREYGRVSVVNYPIENSSVRIAALSPNGRYVIITIMNNSYMLHDSINSIPKSIPASQLLYDREDNTWLPLFNFSFADTSARYEARNFSWSKDSDYLLFCVLFNKPPDSYSYPIYIWDIKKKQYKNIEIHNSNVIAYRIPCFHNTYNRIIFFNPAFTVDTIHCDIITYGSICEWEMFSNETKSLIKSPDLYDTYWMAPSKPNIILLKVGGYLKEYNLQTRRFTDLLSQIDDVGLIEKCNDSLISFIGQLDNKRSMYVYDMINNKIVLSRPNENKNVFRIMANDNFAILGESQIVNGDQQIQIYSRAGDQINSIVGTSPYWIANSDTFLYAYKRCVYICWVEGKSVIKKEILRLEIQ